MTNTERNARKNAQKNAEQERRRNAQREQVRRRKERLERRKALLQPVVALALFGRGATWAEAVAAAKALVVKALKLAKQLVECEWDYLAMTWRTS